MRRKTLRCLKVITLGLLGTFVTAQLMTIVAFHTFGGSGNDNNDNRESDEAALKSVDASQGIQEQLKPSPIPKVRNFVSLGDDPKEKKPSNSLSGERVHGLPNDTRAEKKDSGTEAFPGGPVIDIPVVLAEMRRINFEQKISNVGIFGPVTNDTVVIAIQVHNRLQYLRQLIKSLSKVHGIQRTLLIFSHDFWDPDINALVASVDFAKTMQIFYPYSIQTHPNQFPGESPDDCPRDAKREQAERIKCTNHAWPDLYGHYREAKFTQTKHHWWWKANRIFDQLAATKDYDGLVVFLEEDHHVAEDFLHVLSLVDAERLSKHQDCDIICLGTYLKNFNFPRTHNAAPIAEHSLIGFMGGRPMPRITTNDRAAMAAAGGPEMAFDQAFLGGFLRGRRLLWAPGSILSSVMEAFTQEYQIWPGGPSYSNRRLSVMIVPWMSAKHNMGMAFTRSLWRRLHSCKLDFCAFDDYNWDWSLYHLSITCLEHRLKVMLVKAPRVFHVGECGVHHKKKNCQASEVVKKVEDILSQAKNFLFPKVMSTFQGQTKKSKVPKGNGGWGDLRDRKLCLNMAQLPAKDDDQAIMEAKMVTSATNETMRATKSQRSRRDLRAAVT